MAKLTGTVHEAYVTARELSRVCVRMRMKMITECDSDQECMSGNFDLIAIQLCTGVAGTCKLSRDRARRRLQRMRALVVDVETQLVAVRARLKRLVVAHCSAGGELAERLRQLIDLRITELEGET
jgi:hypothetical protein